MSISSGSTIYASDADSYINVSKGNPIYASEMNKVINYLTPPAEWKAGKSTFTAYDICYGNGKYIIVGNGKIAYSTDLTSWTRVSQSIFSSYVRSVCYENGKFIAVGDDGKTAYSTDGMTWYAGSSSATSDLNGVCYGNGRYVTSYLYSTDGVTWNYATNTNKYNGVCFGNGKFIGVGNLGALHYSTDGSTWTKISQSVITGNIMCCTHGGGKFAAINGPGNVAYCTQGA